MAAHLQVYARSTDLKIAQDHLVEKIRQSWIAQVNLVRLRPKLQAERRLNQRERRRGGPGLRRTGDRIERRPAPALTLEPAKQLGKPPQIHIAGSLEQTARNLSDRTLEAVARKPKRNQCIVVRPDRAIVIGHR